jgi:hypothetical protein
MTTVPGTSFPFVSLTVNVSKFPAEDELTVSGSIRWLKVAVTAVPVTTLSLEFVLVGTFVAPLLGLDEITVGSVAAPTRVPGATVAPGSMAAKTLPIPLPASKTANSNAAINMGGLCELSNLVIFFSSFMPEAGRGEGRIVEFGYIMSNNQIFAKGRRPLPVGHANLFRNSSLFNIARTGRRDRAGCGPDYIFKN